MKLFFSEYLKDYSSYTFSYVPYALYRTESEKTEIYNAGFLPYTGNTGLKHHLYYKARGIRVDLSIFEMGSENRRVIRKFEQLNVTCRWIKAGDFDFTQEDFKIFCIEYSRKRFKGGEMTSKRIDYILHSPFLTHIIEYFIDGERAGYIFSSINEDILHYWYSFYDLENFQDLPLGKYLMVDVIRAAKESGLLYVYLGTCYGDHSLYKVRDFKGVEYHDGSWWNNNIKRLKEWCNKDNETLSSDRFKEMSSTEANEYIQLLISNKQT